MKKYYLKGAVLALGLVSVAGANASALEVSGIETEADLISCLTQDTASTCTLGGDISLTQSTMIKSDIVLNLGSYKISEGASFDHANWGMLTVKNGASLTINGEGDAGVYATNAYGAIRLTEGDSYDATKTAKITLNGGTLLGYYYGIVGNGARHNTEIVINGGSVEGAEAGGGAGIYHPQSGVLTINGGKVIGTTGVAMKGGTLNMNGGEIIATGEGVAPVSGNSDGVEIAGAAIQLESSDKYAGDMVLNFYGGKVSAPNGMAFYEYIGHGTETQVSKLNIVEANLSGGDAAFILSPELADSDVVKQAVANGSYIVTEEEKEYVVAKIANVTDLNQGDYVVLEKLAVLSSSDKASVDALNIENLSTAMIFNIDVLKVVDNEKENDPGMLTFVFNIDKDKILPADGYIREWHMIRIHDGEAAEIPVVVDEDAGTATFSSDKFSTYLLTYVDTAVPSVPDTGNYTSEAGSVNGSVAVIVATSAVMLGGAVLAKRVTRR